MTDDDDAKGFELQVRHPAMAQCAVAGFHPPATCGVLAPQIDEVIVRLATDDEQHDALLRWVQQSVVEGSGHDCGEWRRGLRCLACGRLLDGVH